MMAKTQNNPEVLRKLLPGLATCPQAALAEYPLIVKQQLGYPENSILICGMALGYENRNAAINYYRVPRVEVSAFAQFFE